MSEALKIKNFGPIKDMALDIKEVMVVIGTQASGKSTIAKLLAMFRSVSFVIESKNREPDYSSFLQHYAIENYFREDTYLQYSKDGNYQITCTGKGKWSVNLDESFQTQLEVLDKNFTEILKRAWAREGERTSSFDSEDFFNRIFVRSKIDFLETVFLRKQVYIPAERMLFSIIDENAFSLGNAPIPQCFRDFGSAFEAARKKHNHYSVDFLKIKFVLESGKNQIYFDDNRRLLLSETSSGFQSIIPMMMVIDYYMDARTLPTFTVEEPELNLFPTIQKQVISKLVQTTNKEGGASLVITTHSPYVLSILNNFLYAFQVGNAGKHDRGLTTEVIPENTWLNPKRFAAYYLSDGSARSLINPETRLISENELDDVSEELADEFDSLVEISLKKNMHK